MAARATRSASGSSDSSDSSDSSEGSPSTLGGAANLPSWQLSHPAVAARATAELYARRCFVDAMQKRTMPRSSSDADSRCLLLALSHDELDVIVDGLADPLQPIVAVAFSSTCKGLRTPLGPALEVLQERHARAVALCRKMEMSCVQLHFAAKLQTEKTATGHTACGKGLTAYELATLGMILRTNGLPWLQRLYLNSNGFGDAGMQALFEGLGRGAAPSLLQLLLADNKIGLVGAEALAAALGRGAMPKLAQLILAANPIGNQGMAALAAPLRKLPELYELYLLSCGIGDEGMVSLVDNLGKDDFRALTGLFLHTNKITDAGMSTLGAALEAGGLPRLRNGPDFTEVFLKINPASASAIQAVKDALAKRSSL